jgi:hypothetical protein
MIIVNRQRDLVVARGNADDAEAAEFGAFGAHPGDETKLGYTLKRNSTTSPSRMT